MMTGVRQALSSPPIKLLKLVNPAAVKLFEDVVVVGYVQMPLSNLAAFIADSLAPPVRSDGR